MLGYGVSALLTGAVGNAGAWVVLGLLAAVGLLLYFNMTIGDLVAAYLAERDERHEREADEARRAAARRPRGADARAQAEAATAETRDPA